MVIEPWVPGPQGGAPFFVLGTLLSALLGTLILARAPESPLHRAFAGAALSIALFDGGFVFVNSSQDLGSVWLAYRLASIGFCWLPFAASLLVFRMVDVRPPWWLFLPLGLACAVFLWRSRTGVLYVEDFVLDPLGNGYRHATHSPWYWAFQATYLVHALNLALLAWKWSRVTSRRLRSQFAILTLSYAGAVLLHFLQSSVPSMTGWSVPWLITVLPVNALLVSCQGWAIVRYRFLGLDSAWVDWQVLRHTRVPVAQFDHRGKLVWSNPASALSRRSETEWAALPETRRFAVNDRRGRPAGFVLVAPRPEVAPADHRDDADLARLVLAGWSNKEIAVHFGQAEGTVKNRLSRLYRSWGVSGRAALRKRYG